MSEIATTNAAELNEATTTIPDISLVNSLDDNTERLKREIQTIEKQLAQLKKFNNYLSTIIKTYHKTSSLECLEQEIADIKKEISTLCERCETLAANRELSMATKIAKEIDQKLIILAQRRTRLRQYKDETFIPSVRAKKDDIEAQIVGRECRLFVLCAQLEEAKKGLNQAIAVYTSEVTGTVEKL